MPDTNSSSGLGVQQRTLHLEAALQTVRALMPALSLEQALGRLLDAALERVAAERGSVQVARQDGTLCILRARGVPQHIVRETSVEPGQGISGLVVETGTPLLVKDIGRDARFLPRGCGSYGTPSFLSLPIRLHGEVRGVINLNDKRDRRAFSPEDMWLLAFVTEHVEPALESSHRLEQALVLAQQDTLTGLANQGHFWSSLELERERADRYGRELSLVILDIDHFKRCNDRHGHLLGDQVLRRVAQILTRLSRTCDLPARYGGEEFAVILPETDLSGAAVFAEKIRHAVEVFAGNASEGPPVTVSVGVASHLSIGGTATDLVRAADAALYRAKAAGRNRVLASSAVAPAASIQDEGADSSGGGS